MNKQRIIIVLIVISIIVLVHQSYYLVFPGGFLGYLGGKMGGGKKAGIQGRAKSIILSWHKYEVHLHHWLIGSLLLVICLPMSFYLVNPQLFYGSMGGLAVQGIYCYTDWHHILKIKDSSKL